MLAALILSSLHCLQEEALAVPRAFALPVPGAGPGGDVDPKTFGFGSFDVDDDGDLSSLCDSSPGSAGPVPVYEFGCLILGSAGSRGMPGGGPLYFLCNCFGVSSSSES